MKLLISLFLVFAGLVFAQTDLKKAPAQKKYRIYIVHSYSPELSNVQDNNRGIFSALDGKGGIKGQYESKTFYMDSKRNNSKEYLEKTAGQVIKEITEYNPSIVLCIDDDSAAYVAKKLLGQKVPVVLADINGDPLEYGLIKSYDKPGTNITGVIERQNYGEVYRLAIKLTPPVKKMAVILDESIISDLELIELERTFKNNKKVKIKAVKTNSWDTWKKSILQNQEPGTVILPLLFYTLKDNTGKTVSQDEVIEWLLKNSKVPEYGGTSFQVRDGFLASISTWSDSQGHEAAKIAIRILRGESPGRIPVTLPKSGSIDLNLERAKMLKIKVPFDILSNATRYNSMEVYTRKASKK